MSESGRMAAFHHLLLRADGTMPDELVAEARTWLAAGMLVDVAQAIVFTAMTSRIPLSPADIALLGGTLGEAGGDTDLLTGIETADDEIMPLYGLAPVGPEVLAEYGERIPYNIDLTLSDRGPAGPDEVDAALAGAIGDGPGPLALWRCWRYPALDTQWPPAKRMYLVYATDPTGGDGLPAITARLQRVLVDAGEVDPLVTVFADPDTLPMFQRTALGFAALLWTAEPQPEIRIAPLFDPLVGDQPQAATLDHDERDRILRYLRHGVPLVITTTLLDDVVDPARGAAVPMSFRTDGTWVWSDAVAYYLDRHGLAPTAEFTEHIRAGRYAMPEVGVLSLHRTLAAVQAPVAESAVDPVGLTTG
ncbi:hypothetical protein OG792_17785 [Micromonospora sp. NBC_01699]|uniref:hypothetical protein n=1 Tax=Micromonospora sp. NBC_01699 TaxID=2975984 RepID=UPI002E33765A|nr:hypothetical protein [Micromonospora sp. NBC_01699]